MTVLPGNVAVRPFYLDGPAGRLFSICFEPDGPVVGAVLFCPPFAEEMNKSRAMVALAARRLAASGYRVLLTDLFGTGDSAGEFGAARWATWVDDLDAAANWLKQGYDGGLSIWGLRLGAALALDVAGRHVGDLRRLLFWQPVIVGSTYVTQFLRLKLAAQLTGPESGGGTKELRARSAQGESLEIAGYSLAPAMLAAIDGIDLRRSVPPPEAPLTWLEVVPPSRSGLTAVSRKLAEDWRTGGTDLDVAVVGGDPFWATAEIALVPELIDSTAQSFAGHV